MTAEAPTADLAFTRLRERTVAAGQRGEIHGRTSRGDSLLGAP
jgi:hypothetical protein